MVATVSVGPRDTGRRGRRPPDPRAARRDRPTLQPLLRKARERAGLGRSLELRSVEADEREAAFEAATGAR
jgi:hypothetical protein